MNKISFINTLPKAPDMANPVDFDKDANNFCACSFFKRT